MYGTYKTKKYAADKVAFLGLFIATLLIARLLIVHKTSVILSGPIKLNCADLSVSMPAGNGWQNEKQWKYKKNAFILSSVYAPGPGTATALARCRYLLAAPKTAPNELFKQKAFATDAGIKKTGHIQINAPGSRPEKTSQKKHPLVIEWAHLKKQKTLFDIFFGNIQLPNNRQLDIEVHDATGDTNFAEQIFKNVVKSLKFKDNQLLIAGSEIVAEIKKTGLSRLLENQDRETFFLIQEDKPKGKGKHTVGFTMDVLGQSGSKPSGNRTVSNIQAVSFYYIRDHYTREHTAFFQSDNRFDEFVFTSRTVPATDGIGISVSESILDKTGIMTVRKSHKLPQEKTYQPGPAAIPEVFLEQLLRKMVDSKHRKILVDIIDANGKIIPTIIYRIEPENTDADTEETTYALRMQLMDGQELSQKIYLNNQKRISKFFLEKTGPSQQRTLLYTLERTNIKNILREFPERADYILKQSKTLEQNQSEHQEFF